ncbi:MAG: hypothetical protein IJF61_00110 [Clostridia bacterium]|nr:hypothetical protein [Clostridia bacterium]
MDIKLEILSEVISEAIHEAIEYIHIDADKLVNSVSILALGKIQKILQDESITEDFDVVEKIVEIFEKYNLDAGIRHDFG